MIENRKTMRLRRLVSLIALLVLCPIFVQAMETILSESFEGTWLDPRITISGVGNNIDWGVKATPLFGSKAFGFGRSECYADCWDNNVTTLTITFPKPVYVAAILFREFEVGRNIGNGGVLSIDGTPLSLDGRPFYETFGRLPYNDDQEDTTYRTRTFTVNDTVTSVALQSWDITGHSEIFLDDLLIVGDSSPVSYGQAFNVTADWSSTENPNGAWSYNNETTPLPSAVANWMGIQGETFWSYPTDPLTGLDTTPAWAKLRYSPEAWVPPGDVGVGDVIVHSTSTWARTGLANLTWTSPGVGTVDLCGAVWDAGHYDDRDDRWGLKLNGTILAQRGSIQDVERNSPGAALGSNLATGQSINVLPVQAGDVVEFSVEPLYATGHFVGVDLTVLFTPSERQSVEFLTEGVDVLSDSGILTQNQADGLADKLAAVIRSLDLGATRDACNQLQAFVNQVNAFVKSRKLSREEGQKLIDAAGSIRAQIGC